VTRFLVILAVLLAVLLAIERLDDARHAAARRLASTLRPLHPWPAAIDEASLLDSVATIVIRPPHRDTSWTYTRRAGHWRYPADHDAFVDEPRVERLLRGTLLGLATVVATDTRRDRHLGFDPATPGAGNAGGAMAVELLDAAGIPLLAVRLGRGAPGPSSGECYARVAGADTVFQLHADPRQVVAPAARPGMPAAGLDMPAPMLDPHVFPRALPRRATVRVVLRRTAVPDSLVLQRITIEPEDSTDLRSRLQDGPTYRWLLREGGRERPCNTGRVFDYLAFLRRLTWLELLDPADAGADADSRGRISLEDETGTTDVLELGAMVPRPAGTGRPPGLMVRNRTTGQLLLVEPALGDWLVPPAAALTDTSDAPSPFRALAAP
jgi:hypothetical protein